MRRPRPGTPWDLALQAHLRAKARRQGAVRRIGPFEAAVDLSDANPFRNSAVPDDAARPRNGDVRRLVAEYLAADRTPRLEYFPGAAPAVAPRLLRRGFVVERRPVVLVRTPGPRVALPLGPGLAVRQVRGTADLADALGVAHAAFGEPPPDAEDTERLRRHLAAGGAAVVACDLASGMVVGSARCEPPDAGMTEIAGVAVRASHRRRGVGAALASALAELVIGRAADAVWLTPEHPGTRTVYERAGFVAVTESLHLRHGPHGAEGSGHEDVTFMRAPQ